MVMMPNSGQSWLSDHIFGSCLVNHYRRLFWVNIPKCASTWGKTYFTDPEWTRLNKDDYWDGGNFTGQPTLDSIMPGKIDSSYRPMIWLRDPLARWISARPCMDKITADPIDIEGIMIALQNAAQDEHTAPQSDFIQGMDLGRAVWFRCDDTLLGTLAAYAHHNTFSCLRFPTIANVGPRSTQFQLYQDRCHSLFGHGVLASAFRDVYYRDYDLLASTKFYTAPLAH